MSQKSLFSKSQSVDSSMNSLTASLPSLPKVQKGSSRGVSKEKLTTISQPPTIFEEVSKKPMRRRSDGRIMTKLMASTSKNSSLKSLPKLKSSEFSISSVSNKKKSLRKNNEHKLPVGNSLMIMDPIKARHSSSQLGKEGADSTEGIVDEAADNLAEQMSNASLNEDAYYEEAPSPDKYEATPFQKAIYTSLWPEEGEKEYDGPPICVSQLHTLPNNTNTQDIIRSINRVKSAFPVLTTSFYRNPKIVDSDVETSLDLSNWREMSVTDSANFHLIKEGIHHPIDVDAILLFAHNWAREHMRSSTLFNVLLIPSRDSGLDYFLIIGSSAILDDMSCGMVAIHIANLYATSQTVRAQRGTDEEVLAALEEMAPNSAEITSYMDMSTTLYPSVGLHHWDSVFYERHQDKINSREKQDIENQLKRLQNDLPFLRKNTEGADSKKEALVLEISKLRQQRKVMEDDLSGAMTLYYDSKTGESFQISGNVRKTIIRLISGEDSNENIVSDFLNKHEVPENVQKILNASQMTLETFGSFTDSQIESLLLSPSEKRKIAALSEFVENRIKECIQEQHKIKFSLERQIQRIARDLESAISDSRQSLNKLESTDDLRIRLKELLTPKVRKILIPAISVSEAALAVEDNSIATSPNHQFRTSNAFSKWGSLSITLEDSFIAKFKEFGQHSLARERSMRQAYNAQKKKSIFTETESDSSIDELDEDSFDDNSSFSHQNRIVEGVCTSAFGVLLKHISGSDKFLFGCRQTYRSRASFIGPYTHVLPVKLDFTKPETSLNAVFENVFRQLRESAKYKHNYSPLRVAAELNVPRELAVQYQHISRRDMEWYVCKGISEQEVKEILASVGNFMEVPDKANRRLVWSYAESDQYELLLTTIETVSGGLECHIKYQQSQFKTDNIIRWLEKFALILEGIEIGARSVQVSSLISRFYQSVFQQSSASNISLLSVQSQDSEP